LFLSESDSYPALLTDLQKLVLDPGGLEEIRNAPDDTIGRSRRTLRRWAWQQDLIELLRAGFVDRVGNVDKDKESDYSLAEVNVDKLLQVSPRTRPAPSVSVGVEPTDVSAAELYNRAGTLVQQGRYDEALATYDRALALNPSYSAALYNRGNVLRQLERNEEALEDYERALAVQPDLDAAWFNKGSVLSSLGRYRQALEAYDQVLRLRPDRTDAIQNRKLVLERIDATEGRTERRRETRTESRTESRTKGTPSSKRPPSTPIDKTPPPKGPSKTD
jgi:tetratricopeptide (TPR) repeat protein